MKREASNAILVAISSGFIVGVFIVDCATPIGIAVWLFYLIPLVLVFATRSMKVVFAVLGITSCLIFAALVVSPSAIPGPSALINRGMGIIVLWIVGIIQGMQIRAEMRAREADKRLHFASAAAGIRTWQWDVRTNQRHYAARCEGLPSLPPVLDFSGPSYLERIDADDLSRIDQAAREALLAGREYRTEFRVPLPDGTIRWIREIGRGFCAEGRDPVCLLGISSDITEQRETEEKLKQLVLHKELLMKELQHRVKNSLALVSSLVGLEIPNLAEARAQQIFRETQDRIGAVAKIYDLLYRSTSLESVDLRVYVSDVARSLFNAYVRRDAAVHLVLALEEAELDTKRSVPIGLILNELIINALKYAFPRSMAGVIQVVLRRSGNELIVSVVDNGVGVPRAGKTHKVTGVDQELIHLLAKQIDATVSIRNLNGTHVEVRLPM
jgi:two-component sensor histidine kinase/PAS domain-containing protein